MDPIVQIFYALIILAIASFSVGVCTGLLAVAAKAWIDNRHK